MSDCVIVLDNRVIEQVATRRLRVVKYRGSVHGSNEYPFLIGENGFSVMPITSIGCCMMSPTSASPPACPSWTRCWAGKAITAATAVF